MHRSEATLYCANPLCQGPNPVSHRFCQTCRAPLTKHFLWLAGQDLEPCQPGTLIWDRYWCQQERVFLDTKPALLPEFPEEVSAEIEPYLRLITLQPHMPQVYAVLPASAVSATECYLLEKAPIYPAGVSKIDPTLVDGTLMPAIRSVWKYASGLRQLSWLWQLAHLWQVCQPEGMGQTLLNSALLRVEGGLVRVLELQRSDTSLSLVDVGNLWQQWLPEAHPEIADFLRQLCQQLVTQQINTSDHLIAVLDQAIATCSQTYQYQIQIATLTDQGPTRQRNEDACSPTSGSVLTFRGGAAANSELPYVIVCDGIGGHEGGNIASNLAIATLEHQFQTLPQSSRISVDTLIHTLDVATVAANDAIVQRNDAEQRHERQRMGTTLVMALAQTPELYLAHIGDSRAYRITPTGCHQITLDDDVATREVRLGYALYREALRQPSAGSLVQALGMNSSSLLRPTVQRYLLDEDCVFLLCSDGLSDNDRVEQSWQTYLLPLLQGTTDLATVAQQLIAVANQQNGHDNATVGLVHCRVVPSLNPSPLPVSATLATLAPLPPVKSGNTVLPGSSSKSSTVKTKNLAEMQTRRSRRPSPLFLLLSVVALGGLLAMGLLYGLQLLESAQTPEALNPTTSAPTPIPSLPPLNPSPDSPSTFAIGTRVLVNRSTPAGEGIPPIVLLSGLNRTTSPDPTRIAIPVGSVLEVTTQQQDDLNQRWLGVKVCSVPSGTSTVQTAESGERGWVQETAIAPFVTVNVSLTSVQLGQCATQRQPSENDRLKVSEGSR